MKKTLFTLALSAALANPILGIAQTNEELAESSSKTAFEELETFLHQELTTTLHKLGVDTSSLEQEKKAILAEENEKVALEKAKAFYEKYHPSYLEALASMKLSETAVKEALIQAHAGSTLNDYLSII